MKNYRFHHHPLYERLAHHAQVMNGRDHHLRHLVSVDQRLADFSTTGSGLFFDYSHQRVDGHTMDLLYDLADAAAFYDGRPRYVVLPGWESSARLERALDDVNLAMAPVLNTLRRDGTTSFVVYEIGSVEGAAGQK